MADERSKNTIKKRVISGLIIFALIIVFGLVGSIYLGVVLCVLSCVGYVEFTKATSVREKKDKTEVRKRMIRALTKDALLTIKQGLRMSFMPAIS